MTSGQITEEILYATNAFLWEKFNNNGFYVRKVFISQFLQKLNINHRIFKQK
jgi:hypothetical protein